MHHRTPIVGVVLRLVFALARGRGRRDRGRRCCSARGGHGDVLGWKVCCAKAAQGIGMGKD